MEIGKSLDNLLENTGKKHLILNPFVRELEREEIFKVSRIMKRHDDPQLLLSDEAAVVLEQIGVIALGHDVYLLADVLLELTCFLVLFQIDSFDGHLLPMTRERLVMHGGSPDQSEIALAYAVVPLVA
jgi:hypothetical protein